MIENLLMYLTLHLMRMIWISFHSRIMVRVHFSHISQ